MKVDVIEMLSSRYTVFIVLSNPIIPFLYSFLHKTIPIESLFQLPIAFIPILSDLVHPIFAFLHHAQSHPHTDLEEFGTVITNITILGFNNQSKLELRKPSVF